MPARTLRRRDRRSLPLAAAGILVAIVGVFVALSPAALRAAHTEVRILGSEPASLDPIAQSDAGSAQTVAQIFETLTSIDAAQHVQPALAASWEALDGGKRVVFHLRSNLAFSDGSHLGASDVVASWMRLLSPSKHAPLASLLDDVVGALDYRTGKGPQSGVGLTATNDLTVEVRLLRPAADLPAIASSPTLAIVPADVDAHPSKLAPGSFVGSGAYVVARPAAANEVTLTANGRYWAGEPAVTTVHLITDTGGKSPVSLFQSGDLDYTPIGTYDASWIAFDKTLGPALRTSPSASVDYYGFDVRKAPFSNVHVRRALRMGVDWRKLVALEADPSVQPATSIVPPGLPGRSDADFGPTFDLAAAKSELAAAGYPDGKGFPKVALITSGGPLDEAIVRQLHDNLGIDIDYETLDWDSYVGRLNADPPAMWAITWVADYPGANDFLGLLLGTGKENNWSGWSSPTFDAAIDRALSTTNPTAMQQAFDAAQAAVRDEVPVIPVSYSAGYALSADGLLGAAPNGQGIIRFAGLAWKSGS